MSGPTVAFDVLGTLFDLGRPREELTALGAPSWTAELWIAQALRDALALSYAGGYRPLRDVLEAELPRTLAMLGVTTHDHERERVMRALAELDPAPGAGEACSMLHERGWRLVTLTNSSAEATRKLLIRTGLEGWFADVLTCDAVRRTKPAPEVYELARKDAGGDVWLVAAHAWDVMGAARAGLKTVWVAAPEREYLSVYPAPDIVAGGLREAAERLIARGGK